ncbi:glycosyltransferase family 4 protein [Psychromarinibacter sp. S121]|uniref:glycosyltransferase family 4 protein n=1 Tax=Psychromarinibacter sp. S121 TaxID=3415127 RepID=UPI003C7E7C00
MRIVHAITCLLRAGAEENTIATCNAQAARGHDVWLVFGRDVDQSTLATVDDRVQTVQEPILLREISPVADAKAIFRLTRIFREIAPDVVHTHQSKAGFLARYAARRAKVPIIVHGVHILPFLNVSAPKRAVYLAMERLVAPYTDAFLSVSKGMRDAGIAAGLGKPDQHHIVYSGMDLERFRLASVPYGRPTGRMIVFVASLEERKQHGAFLRIFANLVGRHPDLTLCLFGQGELEDQLKAEAADLGVGDSVRFMGFRSDVGEWITAADICVLPSLREGLPRVVVQYVAAGKPVVVTDLPGIEEIVQDGENGFVVGMKAFDDMENVIERLLSEHGLAERMARASRAVDLSRWSVAGMEPKINEILLGLARKKGLEARISPHAVSASAD